MSRIPAWAYPLDGYGEGRLAWIRGFLRLVIPIGGFAVAVALLGWWGLLTLPLLFLLPIVIDGLVVSIASRRQPPPDEEP